jgi:hypothetical protein
LPDIARTGPDKSHRVVSAFAEVKKNGGHGPPQIAAGLAFHHPALERNGQGAAGPLAHIVHKRFVQHSFAGPYKGLTRACRAVAQELYLCSTARTIQLTQNEQERRRWAS